MKFFKNRRQLTLLSLVFALFLAVYLNWTYAKAGSGVGVLETVPTNATAEETLTVGADDTTANKNYGDAQLVSTAQASSGKEYFDSAKLARSKARDEALEKLQKSLKNSKLSETEKKELTLLLSTVIDSITVESDIENLVKAKGFVDCLAYIKDGTANITVMTSSEALNKAQVAQIKDIAVSKTGFSAQNITIVEVK